MVGSLLALLILSLSGTERTLPPVSKMELGSGLLTQFQSDLAEQIDERGIDFTADTQFMSDLRDSVVQDRLLAAVSHSKVTPRSYTSAETEAFAHLLECAAREYKAQLGAIEQCEAALKTLPNNSFVLTAVAYVQASHKCLTGEALSNIQKAIGLAPESSQAHRVYGFVWSCMLRPDSAIHEYLEAVNLDPNNARAHFDLGMFYGSSKADKAVAQLKQALHLDPANAYYHYWAGDFLQWQGKTDEALLEYEEAENSTPQIAFAHTQRAGLLAEIKRYDEAIQEAKKAVELSPKFTPSILTLAAVLIKAGDFEQAMNVLKEARPDPDNPFLIGMMVDELVKKGDLLRAISILRESIAGSPNLAYVYRYRLAELLEMSGDLNGALDEYRELILTQGDSPQLEEAIKKVKSQLGSYNLSLASVSTFARFSHTLPTTNTANARCSMVCEEHGEPHEHIKSNH